MNSHANLVPRYKHLREVARGVSNAVFKSLPYDVVTEAGRKLGVLRGKTYVLDSEDEMAVIMDYALYDVRRQGRNGVERYLADTPPPPDSEEMLILQGMREARYALLVIEAAEPGAGVQVLDAIRGDTFFVMDIGFSTTARLGFVLATRVKVVDGITMTTGAGLPAGMIPEQNRDTWLRGIARLNTDEAGAPLSPERASERNATIIRSCLEKGAASHIAYQDLPGSSAQPRLPSAPVRPRLPFAAGRPGLPPVTSAPAHIGRNDPCSCGSGKKFKNCCLRKR